MNVINIPISEITPYAGNTKKHDQRQIDNVAASIRQYGFVQPLVIDKNNVIVIGHCRFEAAKKLKWKEVPCVRADTLTEDEVKALRLADNKLNESDWDFEILFDELDGLDFGEMELDFDIDITSEEEHWENKEKAQYAKSNILNLEKAQFPGVGLYDIPQIQPIHVSEIGNIQEWIGFNYVLSDRDPKGKAVHFFVDDYQFERVFNQPERYIDKLKQYRAVLSPDFSPYGDMPMATQIYNHYRKHWVAAYWQQNGVRVIPTIRASTDPRSLAWYLDGEPKRGVVCISSMYTQGDEAREYYINEHNTMVEKLEPEKVFVYGKIVDGVKGNVERIPTFSERRFR